MESTKDIMFHIKYEQDKELKRVNKADKQERRIFLFNKKS